MRPTLGAKTATTRPRSKSEMPREHFRQVASAWCLFMGWLKDNPAPPLAYAAQLQVWAAFLRSEAHLAEGTISGYCWWIRIFLQWLERKNLPLRRLTLPGVDQFT